MGGSRCQKDYAISARFATFATVNRRHKQPAARPLALAALLALSTCQRCQSNRTRTGHRDTDSPTVCNPKPPRCVKRPRFSAFAKPSICALCQVKRWQAAKGREQICDASPRNLANPLI